LQRARQPAVNTPDEYRKRDGNPRIRLVVATVVEAMVALHA
jgi:hypothetical protein